VGRPPRRGSPAIGYVPQQRLIDPLTPLRARDLVRSGIDGHRWGVPLPRRAVRERVDALLASVGASAYADVPVGLLSGGQRQAVAVARATAFASRLVILDEPTAALGLRESRQVLDLIVRLRAEGKAVIVISHAMDHVIEVADRAMVLRRGRKVGELVPSKETHREMVALIVGGAA
jgi:zinc/manganese transport system ATP-binding protein